MPLVGTSSPRRILISVDFPAPLAPISPVTPGATGTVRPSSAVTPPGYTLVSAVASITAEATIVAERAPVEGVMGDSLSDARRRGVRLSGEIPGLRPAGRRRRKHRGLRLRDEAPRPLGGYL